MNPEIVLHLPQVVDTIRHSAGVELQVNPYNRATYTKPWFRVKNDTVGSWIEIPFEVTEAGRYSMSLFQHLREDNGIWKVYHRRQGDLRGGRIADRRRLSREPGQPAAAGTDQQDAGLLQRLSQGRARGLHLRPDGASERSACSASSRASTRCGWSASAPTRHRPTRKPASSRYNLSADVLSVRKLPFDNFDEWIEHGPGTGTGQ